MLKILQITDLHIRENATDTLLGINTYDFFNRVLQHARKHHGPFDLQILTGDLAQDPSPASYQLIAQTLNRCTTSSLCLPGNHDDVATMQAILNSPNISCSKYLHLKNWRIIALNSQKNASEAGELSNEELDFLQKCLQNDKEAPTLIAVHHHSLASGSVWLDAMRIGNYQAFLDIVTRHRACKIVTNGHVHQQSHQQLQGIDFYSTPATCFQFKPHSNGFCLDNATPGYRVFELNADGSHNSYCYRIDIELDQLQIGIKGY